MMPFNRYAALLSALLFIVGGVAAEQPYGTQHCRALQLAESNAIDTTFTDSLLWKIERPGYQASYLLGTIHVTDPRVLALPDVITDALQGADRFIMEMISTDKTSQQLNQIMFSAQDGALLNGFDDELSARINAILSLYNIPRPMLASMQPWAAYLIMNYPPGNNGFLDLKLFELARQQHKAISGLETLDEQISVFTELDSDKQIQLLLDSVCHYQQIQEDLAVMIEHYLSNDLDALATYSQRYSLSDEPLYQHLLQRLIVNRNTSMIDRIIPHLKDQSSFIAIGALHLPGKDGVLSGLQQAGFTLTPIDY